MPAGSGSQVDRGMCLLGSAGFGCSVPAAAGEFGAEGVKSAISQGRATKMLSEIVDGTYDDWRSPQSVGDRVQIIGITRDDLFGSAPSDHSNTGVDDVRRRRVPQNLPHESGMFHPQLTNERACAGGQEVADRRVKNRERSRRWFRSPF